MDKTELKISQETFAKLEKCSGLVYLEDIKGIVNLNSVVSIIPEELANKSSKERLLHDGTYAIQRGGIWVMKSDPNVRLDIKYFPELRSEAEQAKYDQVRLEREEQEMAIAEINRKRLTN